MTQISLPGNAIVIADENQDKAILVKDDRLLLLSEYIESNGRPSPQLMARNHQSLPIKVAIIHPIFIGKWLNELLIDAKKINVPNFIYYGQRTTYSQNDINQAIKNYINNITK